MSMTSMNLSHSQKARALLYLLQ